MSSKEKLDAVINAIFQTIRAEVDSGEAFFNGKNIEDTAKAVLEAVGGAVELRELARDICRTFVPVDTREQAYDYIERWIKERGLA